MGIRAQYQQQNLHTHTLSAKITATILTDFATQTSMPHLPGRHNIVVPVRLPGIRALLGNWNGNAFNNILPPLQSTIIPMSPVTPEASPSSVVFKSPAGSPTSPSMTAMLQSAPTRIANLKTRRPLALQDLLSVETSPLTQHSDRSKSMHHRRQCGIVDCVKYALSGGFCIRHGGGKRCNFDGCLTVAQSGGRCKAHGGGSKCKVAGCGSVARRKGFCMSHGGRQQCKIDGCARCAHGGGFCIAHGGGKRCSHQLCAKSAQAGGFCYSHGGGKRCNAPECFQAARKGGLCIRHRRACLQGHDGLAAQDAGPDGHTGPDSRRLGVGQSPRSAPDVDFDASQLWSALEAACPVTRDKLQRRESEGTSEDEEQQDSLHVDELSELFSCVEQEEASGVDFGVFVEDADAVNVEEISELFSCLEEKKEVHSPVAVDSKCDSQELDVFSDEVDTSSKPVTTYSVADYEDAKNVDLVAELFSSLEDGTAHQETTLETRDWIDALEVDNVASLFKELEKADAVQTKQPAPATLDSRIFVPNFSVRIDGLRSGPRPAIGVNSNLLVGPPCLVPAPARDNRVPSGKAKRKTRSFATKQPDPSISDTRRASAAKRQRVKGRFVRDTNAFVSITALQQ